MSKLLLLIVLGHTLCLYAGENKEVKNYSNRDVIANLPLIIMALLVYFFTKNIFSCICYNKYDQYQAKWQNLS